MDTFKAAGGATGHWWGKCQITTKEINNLQPAEIKIHRNGL